MKRVAVQRRRYWPVTILFVLIGTMLLTGQWQVSHAEAAKSAPVRGVSTPALATSATRLDPRVPAPKAATKKSTPKSAGVSPSDLLCGTVPAPVCGVVTLAGTSNVVPNVRVHLVDSNGNDVAGFSQNPYTVGGNGAFVFGDSGTGSHNPGTFPLNTPLSLMFDPGPTNPSLLKVWWEDKWSTNTACQFQFSNQTTATMVRCGASGTLIPSRLNQQMYQGAVIAGTVTDINTNATLSGIQVDAFGALCNATGLSTFTNENGDYVISGLTDSSSAGSYLMRYTDPNGTYAVQWYNNLNVVSCPGAQGGATAITAVTATPATGKDAHLGQSHSLSVGVVNASHQSVSGVSLLLWLVDGSGNPVSSVSPSFDDGNGGFIFSNVDPNASYKLYANPGTTVGYMPEWYTPSVGGTDNVSAATIIPGSTDSLVVTLDVGGIINGAVSQDNPNGTNPPTIALDGVVVKVFDTNISTTQPVAASTSGTGGTSGSFSTPANLRPDGLYIVEYVPPTGQPFAITWYKHADSLPNYGTSSSSTADIQTVTKGQITTLGNITMPAVKASINGQVFDPTNSPLTSTVTTIHIWKQNNNGDGQNCAAPNVDTSNGNLSYYVRYGDSSTDPVVNVGQTNYVTPSLPLGCYALQFDPQTIDPKVSGYLGGWFTGTSGTPPTDISGAAAISLTLGGASAKNINLPFAITIAGTIFNSQSQGAAGVAVLVYTVNDDNATPVAQATTTNDGSFRTIPLPGGTQAQPLNYYVKAKPGPGLSDIWYGDTVFAAQASPIASVARNIYTIQINLKSTGLITGDVNDASTGNPFMGATVTVYLGRDPNAKVASTTTAADGSYTLNVVPTNPAANPPTFYTVKFSAPNAFTWYNDRADQNHADMVSVDVGNITQGINGNISVSTYSMSGTVTDQAAQPTPLANITVNVYAAGNVNSPLIASATTDQNGKYTFDPIFSNSAPNNLYCIHFVPPTDTAQLGSHFFSQWYYPANNTPSDPSVPPQPCNITVTNSAITANAKLAPRALVSGQILLPNNESADKVVVTAYRWPVSQNQPADFTLVNGQNGTGPSVAGVFSFSLPLSQSDPSKNNFVVCATDTVNNNGTVCFNNQTTPQTGTEISFVPESNDTKTGVILDFRTTKPVLAIAAPGPKITLLTVDANGTSATGHVQWSTVDASKPSLPPYPADWEVDLSDPNTQDIFPNVISMPGGAPEVAAADVPVTGLQLGATYYYKACSWDPTIGKAFSVCSVQSAFATPTGGNPIQVPGAPLSWYFPDGEYSDTVLPTYTVFNPNTNPKGLINVTITYIIDGVGSQSKNLQVQPQARLDINPTDAAGVGSGNKNKKFSVFMNSDQPFLAEVTVAAHHKHTKAMFYDGQYTLMGGRNPASDAYFPSVTTAGSVDTVFTFMNTGSQDSQVVCNFTPDISGAALPPGCSKSFNLPKNGRVQVALSDLLDKAVAGSYRGGEFGLHFTTNTGTPIIAQQTTYYKTAGSTGAASVYGLSLPVSNVTTFTNSLLAAGTDTSFSLMNTSGSSIDVDLTFTIAPPAGSTANPTVQTATISVPGSQRVTINPALPPAQNKPWQIGRVGMTSITFTGHAPGNPSQPSNGVIVTRSLYTAHPFFRSVTSAGKQRIARTSISGGGQAQGQADAKHLWFFAAGDTLSNISVSGTKTTFAKADDETLAVFFNPTPDQATITNQANITYYFRTSDGKTAVANRELLLKPGQPAEISLSDATANLVDPTNPDPGSGPNQLTGMVIHAALPVYIERGYMAVTAQPGGWTTTGVNYSYGVGLQ